MKRLIVALALVASLGMAGHALAMDKKINIFNGAQYDIYTLYLSPTNANDWEENLLKQETLPNGDKVDVEVSRTEKAEAWDVKVTNKAGETMTWIGVPLNKAGQITLLPDGKYEARNPETTTGGRALKFYASVRMDVRRIETLKQSGEMVGNRTRIKIVKNKIAPPFKEAEFDIMFGKGISKEGDVLDLAVGIDLVKKSGAWYAYEGEKIGQGRENAKAYLTSHPEVMEELDRKVRQHYHLIEGEEEVKESDLKLTPKEEQMELSIEGEE